MSTHNRPLSPHLQIYAKQLTSVLSITHRLTGIALSAGTALFTIWLLALAAGPEAFARVNAITASVPGKLIAFLFTAALYYHMCNGVRHLFWDAGYGFELPSVYASGKAVIACAAVLTVLTWVVCLAYGGGA